jgi:agmatine/peptidylarginine deiminase
LNFLRVRGLVISPGYVNLDDDEAWRIIEQALPGTAVA